MPIILNNLRQDLKNQVDPVYKKGSLNFFKEPIKLYGVRSPLVKKLESRYWPEVKALPKADFIKLTEELFKSNYNEEFSIGSEWLYRRINEFKQTDFQLLENWLKKYVTNWGMCDDYCTHALGYFIYKYPKYIAKTKIWTQSNNRWVKRASAVSHIHPTKLGSPFYKNILKNKKQYLNDIFEIANKLMAEPDDLVQKGYGWLLKEASNLWPKEIYNFVMRNKKFMSRTALRYAIEKLPPDLKLKCMLK